MQISDLTNQYTSTNTTPETVNGTRGVETLVSAVRNLTAGNIFEGTVNAVKGNQVVLGLSNGTELMARIEMEMQLVQGQSMFFQVKSNDGNTVAIRPYTVDGNGANLTLLNALSAANLPVSDKYLNMVNQMMQEQMPIDKNSMGQMARILMNHPEMNVQTLVSMKKLGLPITTEMVSQFENYMDDKSALHNSLNRFVTELPATMASGKMSLEQMKTLDSRLLMILTEGLGAEETNVASKPTNTNLLNENVSGNTSFDGNMGIQAGNTTENTPNVSAQGQNTTVFGVSEGSSVADTQINTILVQTQGEMPQIGQDTAQIAITGTKVGKAVSDQIKSLYGDIGIAPEDSPAAMLQKLANHIATGSNVSKDSLQTLFASKDMQHLLKQIIEEQVLLEPKNIRKGDNLKELYERLDAKTQKIESLLQNTGLKETPLNHTVQDIHANVDFMNKINETYTYVQVPLKMTNQNASGQLYVYTNKRHLADPEAEVTAFLHLDLDHLGSTDVSVRMYRKEVSTKFYMDNDASYDLLQAHMPQLEERLRAKGYNCKIEIENEGKHVNFVEDFLKKDAPSAGMLHRYSFDVRT